MTTKITTTCAKCDKTISILKKDVRLCETCMSIDIIVKCAGCGKDVKLIGNRLFEYFTGTKDYFYCSNRGCILKHMHKLHSRVKYCEICKDETKHMLGIGCMTCYNRDEKHKKNIVNTVKERYGEEYTNVFQVKSVKDGIAERSMIKYNTPNPGNCRDSRIKANMTMRSNENGSSYEDYLEKALIENNIVYKKQYSDERYPYLCDFYLVESDTFIEINAYWSHGGHKFDYTNIDDITKLNLWKNKAKDGHKQYKNAVNVWSIKDIEKHNYDSNNNLNYITLWTYNDISIYIDQIMYKEINNERN